MKTYIIKPIYLLLISLFILTTAWGDIFDSTRANVWVIDGEISQSFSVDEWTTHATLAGSSVDITTEESSIFPITNIGINQFVIVNNVLRSAPNASVSIPSLSFAGLSIPSNNTLDSSQASISISPNGGYFNKTIEVTFTLNAPKRTKHELFYAINEVEQTPRTLTAEVGKNSYSIFLVNDGTYAIEYGIKTSSNALKLSHFEILSDNPNRDSDGDGIPDHIEVELGLNPLDGKIPDSDNDGWNDFDEYIRGTDSTLQTSTPVDSDSDGWSDFDENLRGTDPLNSQVCIDKPTAASLYSVEYLVDSKVYLGENNSSSTLTNIHAISLINLQSTSYFDSVKIMNEANSALDPSETSDNNSSIIIPNPIIIGPIDIQPINPFNPSADANQANSALDLNKTLCRISKSNLVSTLKLGNTPTMRASADIPLISRIVGSKDSNVGGYILKAFLRSSPSSTVKKYLLSDTFGQLSSNDYNASTFKDSYIAYLEETLVQTRKVDIHQNSSMHVGFLESAFRSRVDANSTLYLGNPTIPVMYDAYVNTLKSISSEDRSFNALYNDVVAIIESKSPTLLSSLLPMFDTTTNDRNDTERILATYLQEDLTTQENYYLSLMSIISLETAESNSTVFTTSADTDEDGLSNGEEVFPVYYTHPLKADSDNDNINDADDICPQDSENGCLNDGLASEDTDSDGLVDAVDNCPFDANPDQNDTDMDGIGDICAQKGIVIINPRTNIRLFKGETFHFSATLLNANKTPIWSINQGTIASTQNKLSYAHTFDTVGKYIVCVGFPGEEALSCVDVSILERNIDNDISIYTYDIIEGDSGTKNLLVEVVLEYPSKTKVTFTYHTEDGTANENSDYGTLNAAITFYEGDMRQYINIPIVGDTSKEDNETFDIVINDTYRKTITIIDDDTGITPPADTTPPIITILGENPMYLTVGGIYIEKNATAFDAKDGNVDVNTSGIVDTNNYGSYSIVYSAEDFSGNEANATRTVIVVIISPHDIAIEKIKAFAAINGDAPAPTVQDYIDAGVTGIDDTNLADMNEVVQNLNADEVDTTEELQVLANAIGSNVDVDAPVFTSNNTVSVNENQTSAITLVATDANTVTYSISGTDAASFTVDGATGVVAFNAAPDFETKNTYTFTAIATDSSNNNNSQNIMINILDINESNTSDFRPFKLKIKTDNFGGSSDVEFKIPIVHTDDYNYSVDCNDDGIFEAVNLTGASRNYTCDYTDLGGAGTYTISITGIFPRIYFFSIFITKRDNSKVLEIAQWGDIQWGSMHGAFASCDNMTIPATDKPDLSHVTDVSRMFAKTTFDDDISDWDVSNVTDMEDMFEDASFNQDISSWDVSNVTDMAGMFSDTTSFNQNISSWNVSNVTDMTIMFAGATSFTNHDLSGWDVQNVTKHGSFFNNAGSGNIEPNWP